jgi:hypothetical protein
MFRRLRTTSLAGSSALVLALVVSGMVAAASILTAVAAPVPDPTEPAVVDTTATFEDVNGDGIDDDCQDAVEVDETAAAAAEAAVDLNGDGTIQVSEAAQSDRVGGENCNHGGYVSDVAHETCADTADSGTTGGDQAGDPADTGTNADEAAADGSDGTEADETTADETEPDETDADQAEAPEADCATTEEVAPAEDTAETTEDSATCDAAAPTADETSTDGTETATETTDTTDTAPNAHGKAVSDVARLPVVGGKNCNHGGAVSEAAHADKEARDAARAAAKAAAKAERDAAKAAREAAREAKSKGSHGKGHGHNN